MIESTSYYPPFWAEPFARGGGRDHLGIQNSSVHVYSTLLPGLNNRTYRIRYYGYYMWLLEKYAREKATDSEANFRKFIRRAELLMAYLMLNANPEEQRINGSDFVYWVLNNPSLAEPFRLSKGADKGEFVSDGTRQRRYWQNLGGAFGQIFIGPLKQLKWIGQVLGKKIYGAADGMGKQLAEAFGEVISHSGKTEELFDSIISLGELGRDDLERLEALRLVNIVPYSKEWLCYKDYLVQCSEMESGIELRELFRRQTLRRCLEMVSYGQDCVDLPVEAYYRCITTGKNLLELIDIGWYYYRCNELVHYALETVLWGIIEELKSSNAESLERDILESCASAAVSMAPSELGIENGDEVEKVILHLAGNDGVPVLHAGSVRPAERLVTAIHGCQRGAKDSKRAIGLAGILLLRVAADSQRMMTVLNDFKAKIGGDKHGNAVDLLARLVHGQALMGLDTFFRNLLMFVIETHLYVATQKLARDRKDVLKLTREDGKLRMLGEMGPVFTSPRLANLRTYMVDMQLVKEGNGQWILEDAGHQLLEELR